jgi:hypothetical protein
MTVINWETLSRNVFVDWDALEIWKYNFNYQFCSSKQQFYYSVVLKINMYLFCGFALGTTAGRNCWVWSHHSQWSRWRKRKKRQQQGRQHRHLHHLTNVQFVTECFWHSSDWKVMWQCIQTTAFHATYVERYLILDLYVNGQNNIWEYFVFGGTSFILNIYIKFCQPECFLHMCAHGNVQDAATDLATLLAFAVLAVGQCKKPDLQTFSFLTAGSKEHGCFVNCQSLCDSSCCI